MSDKSNDYFSGYVAHLPHPWMAATGSEGRCELCGGIAEYALHRAPWTQPGTAGAAVAPWDWRERLKFSLMPSRPCPPPQTRGGWRPEDTVVVTTVVSLGAVDRLRVLLTGHLKVETRTVTEFVVGATQTSSVAYPVWKP